jgi:hypothetical protein
VTRRIVYVIAALSLAATGTYLLVYLYRWEWNRALIAGIMFVATEIGVGLAMVVSKLRSIDQRLERIELLGVAPAPRAVADPGVLAAIEDAAPPQAKPFAWLDRDPTSMNVFVPLLLGAGMVVSALAWVVERVARSTAGAAMERGLAMRLAPLSLPAGGFMGGPTLAPPAVWRRPRRTVVARVLGLALAALLLFFGIDAFADLTQDRPDPLLAGTSTALVIEVKHRETQVSAQSTAEAFWVSCRRVLPRRMEAHEIAAVSSNRARLIVTPAIGEHALRRFQGCIEDALIDRIQANVVSVEQVAAADRSATSTS